MLRRDRLIRMQIHQGVDALLFFFSFWLAYTLRANASIIKLFHLNPVSGFDSYHWVWVLVLTGPLVLEAQSFYNRPLSCSRWTTAWLLFKGCLFVTLGIIFTLFLARSEIARWVMVW